MVFRNCAFNSVVHRCAVLASGILGLLSGVAANQNTGGIGPDDRAVAKWVIEAGGIFTPEGGKEAIRTVEAIGDQPFEIASIEFWYTKNLRDKDLVKLKGLSKLSFLRFVGTPLTGTGFEHLSGMKSLRFLDVNGSRINNDGIRWLGELPELHTLWIQCEDVNDASTELLAQLTSLRELSVLGCEISDKGLAVLASLPNLVKLHVDKTKVTADAVAALKNARPSLNVIWTPPPPYISPELPRPLPPSLPLIPAEEHLANLEKQLQSVDGDRLVPGRIKSVDEIVDKDGKKHVGKVIEYGTHVVMITNEGRQIFKRADLRDVALKRRPEEMNKPDLPDLDVTHIERAPRMRSNHGNVDYRDGLPFLRSANPDLAHPPAGTEVTFTAHIINKGTRATGDFNYELFIDDRSIGQGRLGSLAPSAEATATAKWAWEDGPHTVKCVVTPLTKTAEVCIRNNQLADRTDAYGFLICVTKESYDEYNSVPNMVESFSFEDWVQFQFEVMNRLFAESIYPNAPNGCLARIRVDRFLYPSAATFAEEKRIAGHDGRENGFYYQGTWQFEKQKTFDPSYMSRVDWGFLHEMGHQLGLIDEYHWYSHLWRLVSVKHNGSFVRATHQYSQFMTMMDNHGPNPFSSLATLALNRHLGRPFGDYGEFLYAFPDQCELRVLDRNGQGVPNTTVTFYQRRLPSGKFLEPAASQATTNSEGVLTIPNQGAPVHEGVAGFQLRPNPCGKLRVTGESSYFFAKVQFQEFIEWHFIEMVDFNVAGLAGRKSFRKDIQTHFPGPDAPKAPQQLRAAYRDEHTVDVSFDPVPEAKVYRLYAKNDHKGWGESPFTLLQELQSPDLKGLSTQTGQVYLAATSVDSRGRESGLSNIAYCRAMGDIRKIAMGPDGSRYITDPSQAGILRQRNDRTIDDWTVDPGKDYGSEFSSVAITSTGNLVATHLDHHLYLFSAEGDLIDSIGGEGKGERRFNAPADVSVDRFDNVYVADTLNHRIQMFNKELEFQESLGDGFKEPHGVHLGSGVRLFVADTGNNRVLVYARVDRKWKKVLTIEKLNAPYDVATDSKGRIFVAEQAAGMVSVFDPRGNRAAKFDNLGPVSGLAITADDLILATTPFQRVHELR